MNKMLSLYKILTMTVETLREEARKLGYYLLDVEKKLSDEDVIAMACLATGIHPSRFREDTRQNKVTFARYLAGYYWLQNSNYEDSTIAELLGRDRTLLFHCKRSMSDDIKFFKIWQQKAIRNFNDAIQKAEQLKQSA